jgi:ribosomal protein S8
MKKIFVNICSYRDNLLVPTVLSLLETESGRNQITYGIFEQTAYDDSLEKNHPELANHPKVRYKRIDPKYSDGVMWARHINSLQVEDEEFQYQIDSHMIFDKDWDNFLILDYNQASRIENSDKIVLTSNCKNYDLYKNTITKHIMDGEISSKIGYYQFDKNLRLSAHGNWKESPKIVEPGIHICAGNFFTTTKWLKDVGYNTKIFFGGEEQVISLASFLAGYKIYHQRKIKVYHYLNSVNHKTKQTIDPINEERVALRQTISEKALIDYIYSIKEEELEKYRKATGVDYINRKLEKRCIATLANIPAGIVNDWEIPDREN